MPEQNQENLQPYFETPADFQFRIIDPDAKTMFKGFNELNKDIVTAYLTKQDIDMLLMADSIVGVCDLVNPFLDGFQNTMNREIMAKSNFSKARDGFLLKRFTETRLMKTEKFSKQKNNNEVGD
jgi:hypothetical protein